MNALQVFHYNETSIEFELIDGELYANATAMCQAHGKRPAKWLEMEMTKRYILALEAKSVKRIAFIISRSGGNGGGGSTWIHERLILKLAQWLDVEFEIWCDERVHEVLRGQTAIQKPMTQAELNVQLAQSLLDQERRLSTVEETVRQIEARTATRPDYYTIVGYANLNRLPLGPKAAMSAGQQASRICRSRSIIIEACTDSRFGTVNMYPATVLREVFSRPI